MPPDTGQFRKGWVCNVLESGASGSRPRPPSFLHSGDSKPLERGKVLLNFIPETLAYDFHNNPCGSKLSDQGYINHAEDWKAYLLYNYRVQRLRLPDYFSVQGR